MLPRIFLKPTTDPSVKDPKTMARMPQEGAWYPQNSYWVRRIKGGDVIAILNPPKDPKPPKAKAEVEAKKGSK